MGPMPLLQAPIVGIFSQEGHNGRRDKDNTKKTNAETTRRLGFFFFLLQLLGLVQTRRQTKDAK